MGCVLGYVYVERFVDEIHPGDAVDRPIRFDSDDEVDPSLDEIFEKPAGRTDGEMQFQLRSVLAKIMSPR